MRLFVLSNTLRRAEGSAALLARFEALPSALMWREADRHADEDLLFALARRVVETKSKLRSFLSRAAAEARALQELRLRSPAPPPRPSPWRWTLTRIVGPSLA